MSGLRRLNLVVTRHRSSLGSTSTASMHIQPSSVLPKLCKKATRRMLSTSRASTQDKLRIGYVPEHFSAPLHSAHTKYGLSSHASIHPFPSGTGTMIEAFAANEIDVGIGLTEAWVAGMARDHAKQMQETPDSKEPWQSFHVASSYVESPLRWALSTGVERKDVTDVKSLKGRKVGISRMGSGSHIMSTVLADQQGWLGSSSKSSKPKSSPNAGPEAFEPVVCGPLPSLINAVKDGPADFFMWEHYTTKSHWDDGTLKRLGEIATPWNGWHIAVRGARDDPRVYKHLYASLAQGIQHFRQEKQEVIDWICTNLPYSREDAEAWYKEVKYPYAIGSVNNGGIEAAVASLRKAGVIQSEAFGPKSVLRVDEGY